MCPPRRPLSVINANIIPYKDLSLYIKGEIIRKVEEGKKLAHITKEFNIPDFIIRDIISLDLLRNKGDSKRCPGRLDKYSDRFKRNLISFVRKELKLLIVKIRKYI